MIVHMVEGSIPSISPQISRLGRLSVRIRDFQSREQGSIPCRATNYTIRSSEKASRMAVNHQLLVRFQSSEPIWSYHHGKMLRV